MLYAIAGRKRISKAAIIFTVVVLLLVLSACGTSGVQNSSTDLKESGERAPVTAALSEPSSQKIDESVAATTELAEREGLNCENKKHTYDAPPAVSPADGMRPDGRK